MEIIVRGRMGGKTVEAIKIAARNNYTLVCYSVNEVKRVQKIAEDLGVKIPQPIMFGDFINHGPQTRGIKGFIIDNADMLLERMAGGKPIRAITMIYEPMESPYKIEGTYLDEATEMPDLKEIDPKLKRALLYGEWGNDDETKDNG